MSNGTQKKGLSPLAWIAIGCGALVLVGMVAAVGLVGFGLFKAKEVVEAIEANPAKAAAEMMVRLNPELDLVESDDEAGTITFRNTKTGETATLSFEDIAEGKLSLTTDEGEFTVEATEGEEGGVTFQGPEGEVRIGTSASLENVPDWVPIYPDATETQGTFTSVTAEGATGIASCKTADSAQEVIAYYSKWLEDEGYEALGKTSSTTPQGSFASVSGELAASGRTINVGVVEQGGETQVTINYNEKAQ